jgi:hypothetical protein
MSSVRCGALALMVALGISVAACEDDPTGTDVGSLRVTVRKTGAGNDSDGFRLSLDGAAPVTVAADESHVFDDLPMGTYTVVLSGLAANCTAASNLTSWTVATSPGREVGAAFVVNCT